MNILMNFYCTIFSLLKWFFCQVQTATVCIAEIWETILHFNSAGYRGTPDGVALVRSTICRFNPISSFKLHLHSIKCHPDQHVMYFFREFSILWYTFALCPITWKNWIWTISIHIFQNLIYMSPLTIRYLKPWHLLLTP